jgi:hypothetical protein
MEKHPEHVMHVFHQARGCGFVGAGIDLEKGKKA